MSVCCSDGMCETTPSVTTSICPACQQVGKRVGGQTVKALLAADLRQVQATAYYFCRTADCPVIYFNEDGLQTFTQDMIRERVYQKEPAADDVPICYCFGYTLGDIRVDLIRIGHTTIVADITTGTQAGHCACDIRNPQGSCCLGNVRAVVKASQNEQEAV